MLVYCLASFIHFSHNAEYINDYPNLPGSLTRTTVYLAGLDHYWIAQVSAHTLAMNLTIWFEVLAGMALLTFVLSLLIQPSRQHIAD